MTSLINPFRYAVLLPPLPPEPDFSYIEFMMQPKDEYIPTGHAGFYDQSDNNHFVTVSGPTISSNRANWDGVDDAISIPFSTAGNQLKQKFCIELFGIKVENTNATSETGGVLGPYWAATPKRTWMLYMERNAGANTVSVNIQITEDGGTLDIFSLISGVITGWPSGEKRYICVERTETTARIYASASEGATTASMISSRATTEVVFHDTVSNEPIRSGYSITSIGSRTPERFFMGSYEAIRYTNDAYRYGINTSIPIPTLPLYRPAPENVTLPEITGIAEVDETLTVSDGVWKYGWDTIEYQWMSEGVDISGATSNSFVLTIDEVGTEISCLVTVTTAGGSASEIAVFTEIVGDPYINNVVLLVGGSYGADASTLFYDESLHYHFLTAVGNAQIDTTISKFGGGSILLDGTGDWITVPDHDDWTPNAPYTFEAWVYPLSATTGTIVSHYHSTGSQNSWNMRRGSTGGLQFGHVNTSSGALVTYVGINLDITQDAWHHVAVSYDNALNLIRFFIDGVKDPTEVTLPTAFRAVNTVLRIGGMFTGGAEGVFFHGHIDDMRLTKGTCRYTANFPLPARFPRPNPIEILTVNFTGANGSTTFTDIGDIARTLVAVGNAQIQSNKLELDGTGDLVTSFDSNAWTFNGIRFTWEVFGVVLDTNTITQTFLGHYNSSGNQRGWIFDYEHTLGNLRFLVSPDGSAASTVTGSWVPTVGVAYDIACVKDGPNVYLYVNGTRIASGTYAGRTFDSTAPFSIGAINASTPSNVMNGRLAAIRMTANEAKYTGASYTVPTLPLT